MTAPNPEVTADQVASFPAAAGQAVRELVEEYEARESLEARLAKDADKLECLIQAREYQAQSHEDVPPWIETSAPALQSPSARQFAEPVSRCRRASGGRPSRRRIRGRSRRAGSRCSRPKKRPTVLNQALQSRKKYVGTDLTLLVRTFSSSSRPALRAASGRPPARQQYNGRQATEP